MADSPFPVRATLSEIAGILIVHPRSGAVVPEFGRDDIRELFIHSFRLIYRIADDEIRALTVTRGCRKLVSGMLGEAKT